MPTRARAHTSRRRTPARDSGVREPRRGPLPGAANRPADGFRRRRSGRPACEGGALVGHGGGGGEEVPACGEAAFFAGAVKVESGDSSPRAFSGGARSSLAPSLTPESARGAPAWPARSSGRPGAPSQGQGFAAHPEAVALHGHGIEAGPPFQVRPWAASAPPAAAGVRSGVALRPAPGADGTTVRASQPPDLARREAGEDGAARPEAAGRQTRTRAAADGSDTVRPASLAGPVRPALVSIRRVGLGEGRPSPWNRRGWDQEARSWRKRPVDLGDGSGAVGGVDVDSNCSCFVGGQDSQARRAAAVPAHAHRETPPLAPRDVVAPAHHERLDPAPVVRSTTFSTLPRSGQVQPERPRGADPEVTPWFHVPGQKRVVRSGVAQVLVSYGS